MEVCRLCLDLATESDVKKLEGTYKDATQIVLPEVNTDISSSPVICQQCTSSLDELYAFKASVVEAENQIREKVGDNKCQLQLKEVMTGVKVEKDPDLGKSKDRMCRTCLCAIEGETFTVLKPTQSDAYLNSMLLMCLPEMELELTLDPVMCEQCLCNLQKLYHFKSSCLDIEERLNSYCQQHGTSSNSQINLHSVLAEDAAESKDHNFGVVKSELIDSSVKSEEDDEDVSMSDNSKDLGYTVVKVKKEERDMMLKEEDDTEDGDESMGDDDAGSITDEEIGELKQEELKIEDDDGDGTKKQIINTSKIATMNTCEYCSYTSSSSNRVYRHLCNNHGDKQVLKCEHCDYVTKTKQNLMKHKELLHSQGLPLLKCQHCDYTTKKKLNLSNHVMRLHFDKQQDDHAGEMQNLITCEYCSYTTNIAKNLRRHMVYNHENTRVLKCDHCDFTTKKKFNLHSHVKRRHNEGLPLLKCSSCDYTARFHSDIQKHFRYIHTEVPVLKCDHCDYATKRKVVLIAHTLRQHAQGLPLLKCEFCDYVSKIYVNLRKHIREKHRDMPLVKCVYCEYTNKNQSSLRSHVRQLHSQDPLN